MSSFLQSLLALKASASIVSADWRDAWSGGSGGRLYIPSELNVCMRWVRSKLVRMTRRTTEEWFLGTPKQALWRTFCIRFVVVVFGPPRTPLA